MAWVFDWHGQDSRATGPLDVACTVTQTHAVAYENGTEPAAQTLTARADGSPMLDEGEAEDGQ